MVDLTGGRFIVTAMGAPKYRPVEIDDSVGIVPGHLVEKMPPFTVEWCGGNAPRRSFGRGSEIGRLMIEMAFLAVPVPTTTVQNLAASVLMGDPCGRELADCLIEQGVIDVDGEFAAKVKADTLAKVRAALDKLMNDCYREGEHSDCAMLLIVQKIIADLA